MGDWDECADPEWQEEGADPDYGLPIALSYEDYSRYYRRIQEDDIPSAEQIAAAILGWMEHTADGLMDDDQELEPIEFLPIPDELKAEVVQLVNEQMPCFQSYGRKAG